jgi:hypothetical protein
MGGIGVSIAFTAASLHLKGLLYTLFFTPKIWLLSAQVSALMSALAVLLDICTHLQLLIDRLFMAVLHRF